MPSLSPLPSSRERLDRDFELPSYASGSSFAQPLLQDDSSATSTSPRSSSRRARPSRTSRFRRALGFWWKPALALGGPVALIWLYGLINPHVPGLPALPTVKVQTSSGKNIWSSGSKSTGIFDHDAQYPAGSSGLGECSCGVTDTGKGLCEVYTPETLLASRLHTGSEARLKRKLLKARQGGEPFKIGLLGGSVSACHGLHPTPEYPQGDPNGPGCYSSLLKDWFETAFPDTPIELDNGAIGGMDSSYYAFCGTHHIQKDVDLILLEFDINDTGDIRYQAFFDQLLRVLLEFPSEPAILILGAWAPQVAQDVGYGDPQIVHLPVAHYYDVSYISLKRMIFNTYLRYPKSTVEAFYQPDLNHPNFRGHRVLADLLISYLDTVLCSVLVCGIPDSDSSTDSTLLSASPFSDHISVPFPLDTLHLISPTEAPPDWRSTFDLSRLSSLSSETRHFLLPPSPYAIPAVSEFTPLRDILDPARPDPASAAHILDLRQPRLFCADANDPAHPLAPTRADGWAPFVWNGEKHYWVASVPGARIRVEITVSAGRVAVYFFRSRQYELGDAYCWVDDNEGGKVRLAGYWDRGYSVGEVAYIDEKVTPGDHFVMCELAGETSHPTNPDAHNWRLIAVMAT